jgi:hypothetical protein
MEEGLKNIMFYGTRKEFAQPVKCGVIAAITREAFKAREKHWKSIGFVGRCLIASFSYSKETIQKIHDHIRTGVSPKQIEIISGRSATIEIPSEVAEKIQALAIANVPVSTGFRLHKQLRALIQAHALACDR